jgi:signal transduction histidine kinase
MLASQGTGQVASGECLISMKREDRWEAREFTARSTPLMVAGQKMTLLTLRDISALKRRESLERVFIYDLMSSVQEIRGWTEVMQGAGAEVATVAGQVLELAERFTNEVESQHRLLQAECGELIPDCHPMTPERILDRIEEVLGPTTATRLVRLPTPLEVQPIRTDPSILCGILQDMVLNALEATPMGGQVRIWHERREGHPLFVVHNPGFMPIKTSDQVFKRSFSTKGERGRGLGTYGMKLLGETVLGGKVGFTSNWDDGTRFFIELPVDV